MKKLDKFLKNIRKMGKIKEVTIMLEDGSGALLNMDEITAEEILEDLGDRFSIIITRNVDGLLKHYSGFVNGSKIYGIDGSVMMEEIKSSGETIEDQYYDFPKYFFKDGMKRRK
jgi:hypothetical protein